MRKSVSVSITLAFLASAAIQAATLQENTVFPDVNVIVSQTNWNSQLGLQDRLIGETSTDLSIGQSFEIENPTTLRAITIQNHSAKTWGAGAHALELWIGGNDGSASNFVAGATKIMTTVDLQNTSIAGLSYITFNLDSDVSLTAGNYGFELNWTEQDPANFMYAKRIDGSSTYTNGSWVYDTTIGGTLPFDDPDSPVVNDLVFSLHSSVVGTIASASVDPEEINMLLVPPETAVSESMDFSFSSDTNVNIAISITDQTHPGAFSVLTTTPQVITTNTPVEIQFDNAVAGLENGEVATGNVVIAWNEIGSTTINEISVPVSVANGVAAADNTFLGTVGESWGNPLNWDLNRVPGMLASDPAYIQDGLTATVATNFTGVFPWGTTVRGGATLNIDADLLNMTYIRVGYDTTQYGFVNQSTGSVSASTELLIGESISAATSNSVYTLKGGTLGLLGSSFAVNTGSVFDVSGGAFSVDVGPANINLNGRGTITVQSGSFSSLAPAASDVLTIYPDVIISGGTVDLNGQNKFINLLKVIGDSATISIDRINTPPGGNIGDIVFEMGENGISGIDGNGGGWASLGSYTLTIDGSQYIGGTATFTLLDCANLASTSTAVTVTGFPDGATAVVTQDQDANIVTLTVTVPGYDGWIGSYGLTGTNADWDVDYDLDGEINFYEYAFGGNPTTNASKGYVSTGAIIEDGGTTYFEYVYARRIGTEEETELSYRPEFTTSLAIPDWDGAEVVEVDTGTIDAECESVTNRVDMTGKPAGFIHVEVDAVIAP
ncbi:hypothetical protein P4C99_13170 [Pontiellaceae bacterium B1224]|nr:hypothetical protein [Pontiellaceae bacterium B1224]